ncbi:MAG TPA: ATP-binding protein [Planctomycetota bacterium]|nr:ATP-binding protein [Planctomycetota bacterium]
MNSMLPRAHCLLLRGDAGSGKTAILRQIHALHGGAFLNMDALISAMRSRHPLAVEETFEQLVLEHLAAHACVIVDDLDQLITVTRSGCNSAYPRQDYLNMVLLKLAAFAEAQNKKLIFGAGSMAYALYYRASATSIGDFEVQDYAFLCHTYLGAKLAKGIDFAKVYRFAPSLNAYQLKHVCVELSERTELTTDFFIDYLRERHMTSNVNLGEVQAVDLYDLKGIESIIQSLEANLIVPLENDELAQSLNLKPKRGVLLAGPPGTGKTTVGRALAHRLKSKFFLVDGTIISGTSQFYGMIHQIFESAKQNAPSIIFIDDSDVIFENNEEMGLYRYLLTMLDGLESASANRICVMMTAMDVGHLPPALIRSGRIELWLEMPLPNQKARGEILTDLVAKLPDELRTLDIPGVAAMTEGFTGADLKRLVEDGKTLYAYDKVRKQKMLDLTAYFMQAVRGVQANKAIYARAEQRARQQRPSRPVWFDGPSSGDEESVVMVTELSQPQS